MSKKIKTEVKSSTKPYCHCEPACRQEANEESDEAIFSGDKIARLPRSPGRAPLQRQ